MFPFGSHRSNGIPISLSRRDVMSVKPIMSGKISVFISHLVACYPANIPLPAHAHGYVAVGAGRSRHRMQVGVQRPRGGERVKSAAIIGHPAPPSGKGRRGGAGSIRDAGESVGRCWVVLARLDTQLVETQWLLSLLVSCNRPKTKDTNRLRVA